MKSRIFWLIKTLLQSVVIVLLTKLIIPKSIDLQLGELFIVTFIILAFYTSIFKSPKGFL